MKITCTQENLNQGLAVTGHLANKNVNLPILNNVLLEAKGGTLTLSSTNLEIGISCQIRGKVDTEGTFTVDSKLITDYVNLLPSNQTVDIELLKDDFLNVTCKNNNTRIKGIAADDFPVIPQIERENPYKVPLKEFKTAISQVIFAVAHSETRPEISGVYVHFKENSLTLVGTDSYRLAEKKIALEGNSEEKAVIVPVKALQEVQRILGTLKDTVDSPQDVGIYIADNQILFVIGNIELISRLIEGQYPDYQQIIPSNPRTKTVATTSELIKVIKTISLFSKAGVFDINMECLSDKKSLVLSSNNVQVGESVSEIDVEYDGDANATTLNYRFLLDGLSNIDSEEVRIELIDGNIPCIIKPKDDDSYLYIVMPIKQ
jgi:DNA polymerase-3 subunit beta